ncbi:MAG: hypothetical protein ILO68_06830 [Clostridia bacterium]|nr:hypothetical protein [Clostridia bacterium]
MTDLSEYAAFVYPGGRFSLSAWKETFSSFPPGLAKVCLADLDEVLGYGLDWEKDFLPVLNAAAPGTDLFRRTADSFRRACEGLEKRIFHCFGRVPDADLILYPGLCSGAGWVTELEGRFAVLFGIEKIVELGWYEKPLMEALVFHELGHVHHRVFGRPEPETESGEGPAAFLWQLFQEGIAMVYEQTLMGDERFFHQDRDGWADWCASNLRRVAFDFERDRFEMTRGTQRYFGDWVFYDGRPDAGYYLGAAFVRFCLQSSGKDRQTAFDELIGWGSETVEAAYGSFLQSLKDGA